MWQWFEVFYKTDKVATTIEYAFIAVVVSIAAVAAWSSMGSSVQTMFGSISNDLVNSVQADRQAEEAGFPPIDP